MRIVVWALLIGCSGNPTSTAPAGGPSSPPTMATLQVQLPAVDGSDVLAATRPGESLPLVLLVDERGQSRVGSLPDGTSWQDLAKVAIPSRTLAISAAELAPYLHSNDANEVVLAAIETRQRPDSPLPPPEDDPDDVADRAVPDPAVTPAGLASASGLIDFLARPLQRVAFRGKRTRDAAHGASAARLSTVAGSVLDERDPLPSPGALVAASPRSPATALVDALTHSGGALLVAHGQRVAPLAIDFGSPRGLGDHATWFELRVTQRELVIEAVPDAAISVPTIADLLPAIRELSAEPRYQHVVTPVDVLVAPDVTSQRLLDVLVALQRSGVKGVGLGRAPTPEQARQRGKRVPWLAAYIGSDGALDRERLLSTLDGWIPMLLPCWSRHFSHLPGHGILELAFFIDASGSVTATRVGNGHMIDRLGPCFSAGVKALRFPAASAPTLVHATFVMR